jgi:hypothetical protein
VWMGRGKSGVFGGMDVKVGSKLHTLRKYLVGLLSIDRSPQQVMERLDRLIAKIRDLQRPHMDGSKAVDVVVVRGMLF